MTVRRAMEVLRDTGSSPDAREAAQVVVAEYVALRIALVVKGSADEYLALAWERSRTAWERWDGARPAKPYLSVIGRRIGLDLLRQRNGRRRNRVVVFSVDQVRDDDASSEWAYGPDPSPGPDRTAEIREDLERCLDETGGDPDAMLLARGCTYEQAIAATNSTPGQFKARLHRKRRGKQAWEAQA